MANWQNTQRRSYSGGSDYRRTNFVLKYVCEKCGVEYRRLDGHTCKAGE